MCAHFPCFRTPHFGDLTQNLEFSSSNGHKWLCNARGAAILYVREEFKPEVHPVVISWGAAQGFNAEFIWQGTMDYCAQISMRIAIQFLDHLGGLEKVTERNRSVAHWAAKMLSTVWGTETLVSLDFCDAMVCVRIPDSPSSEGETCAIEREPLAATAARSLTRLGLKHAADRWQCTICQKLFAGDGFLQNHFVRKHADVLAKDQRKVTICGVNELQATLWRERQIEVPFFGFRGKQYIRTSCHVYNSKEEFEALAIAVCEHLALPAEARSKLASFLDSFPMGSV
jgi:selenocysteine lyase/cysteine desulfurase